LGVRIVAADPSGFNAPPMATHYEGTPEESRALDAYVKLVRAADAVSDRIHGHLAATGLSTSPFGVL
jgi:MarR family 2-MHQ and catechol resistance regulon transcriptional repressor